MPLLCRLHSLHLAGPEQWWRIGATIVQAFKAMEYYVRERDWAMAWLWLNLPDPRPARGMSRGLADPLEHSAAIAFLREAHLLEAQRQAIAGRSAWPAASADAMPTTGARGARAAATPGTAAPPPPAAAESAPQGRGRRRPIRAAAKAAATGRGGQ